MVLRAAFRAFLATLEPAPAGPQARARLEEEAGRGLVLDLPLRLAWFPFERLPSCRWDEGGMVAPEVLRWWVRFASFFTVAEVDPLLRAYLALLDLPSRQGLGLFLLRTSFGRTPWG